MARYFSLRAPLTACWEAKYLLGGFVGASTLATYGRKKYDSRENDGYYSRSAESHRGLLTYRPSQWFHPGSNPARFLLFSFAHEEWLDLAFASMSAIMVLPYVKRRIGTAKVVTSFLVSSIVTGNADCLTDYYWNPSRLLTDHEVDRILVSLARLQSRPEKERYMGSLGDILERHYWSLACLATKGLINVWAAQKRFRHDAVSQAERSAVLTHMHHYLTQARAWRIILKEKATLQRYVSPHMGSEAASSAMGKSRSSAGNSYSYSNLS